MKKVRKRVKIRNRYIQSTTPDPGVTTSQLVITNKSQDVSPFQQVATRHYQADARKHNKNNPEITLLIHKRSTALERSVKTFYWRAYWFHGAPTPPLSDGHTLPDSTNGRVTDSKIACPFVSVRMRFLSVRHAVNAFRVR